MEQDIINKAQDLIDRALMCINDLLNCSNIGYAVEMDINFLGEELKETFGEDTANLFESAIAGAMKHR